MDQDYKRAKLIALKILRREELAEEIAQEVLIARWNRTKIGKFAGDIKWQVIYAIRIYYGRTKKGEINRRQFEVLASGGQEGLLDQDFDKHSVDCWSDRRHNDRDERLDLRDKIRFRTNRDAMIYDLFCNGFSNIEMAEIYGVSESMICVIMKRIKKHVETAVLLQKMFNELEENPERFKLKIDWIKI
jgi:DNA-directed RNA polymerase specialized sigma24 family protein